MGHLRSDRPVWYWRVCVCWSAGACCVWVWACGGAHLAYAIEEGDRQEPWLEDGEDEAAARGERLREQRAVEAEDAEHVREEEGLEDEGARAHQEVEEGEEDSP